MGDYFIIGNCMCVHTEAEAGTYLEQLQCDGHIGSLDSNPDWYLPGVWVWKRYWTTLRQFLVCKRVVIRDNPIVAQSCRTLCDPMACGLPDSSVHGVFQARILEWFAIFYSRRSSRPSDWTYVSSVSYIAGRFSTQLAIRLYSMLYYVRGGLAWTYGMLQSFYT